MQHKVLITDNEYKIALHFVAYYQQMLLRKAMLASIEIDDLPAKNIYKYHQKRFSALVVASKDNEQLKEVSAWFEVFGKRDDLVPDPSLVKAIEENLLQFQKKRIKKDLEDNASLIESICAKCSDDNAAIKAITQFFLLKELARFVEENVEHFQVLYQYQEFLEPPRKDFTDCLKLDIPVDIKELLGIIREKRDVIKENPEKAGDVLSALIHKFKISVSIEDEDVLKKHKERRKTLKKNDIKANFIEDIEAQVRGHYSALQPYVGQRAKLAKLSLDVDKAKAAFAEAEKANQAAQNEIDKLTVGHGSSTFYVRNKFTMILGGVGAVFGGILLGVAAIVAAPFTAGLSVLAFAGIIIGAAVFSVGLGAAGGFLGGKALDNRAYDNAKKHLASTEQNLEKTKIVLEKAINTLKAAKIEIATSTGKSVEAEKNLGVSATPTAGDWHKPSENGDLSHSPHTTFSLGKNATSRDDLKKSLEDKEGESEGDAHVPKK